MAFHLQSSPDTGCNGIPEPGQLRFYVSNLRLIEANGAAVPVSLDETPAQSASDGIALVSWPGGCAPDPAKRRDPAVSGQVAPAEYEAVEFELGVPFERNHGNPLTAPPPLNVPTMFWTWQSGHKFLRLDIGTQWSFHLGSTGCFSASAVRPPGHCAQPNLATIRLPAAAARNGAVVVDLEALLEGIDIATADNCVDNYGEAEHCRGLLTRLGLDAGPGRCHRACRLQQLFRFEGGEA